MQFPLKRFDLLFFASTLILSVVGIMMIYSTGLSGSGENTLWLRQLAYLALGLGGLIILGTIDYRFFKKNSSVIYVLSILLLVGVLVVGQEIRGSKRWFELGLINFQPAEFSKLALIVLLAKLLQVKRASLHQFRYVVFSFGYVLVPAGLVILQPDLGSAAVHVAVWAGMLFTSPMPRKYLLYLFVVFVVISVAAWQFFLADYQKDRLQTFLDPTADPRGTGYNVIQSMVAVGSGGLFGHGLARGLQSQLRFLPERQTDFIFASTVEELGLVGGALVLVFLFFICARILKIMRQAQDSFGMYLASGIFFLFLTQITVNIGMNLGLLPVTGITLPFLSYGGSSLVTTFLSVGIIESIARHSSPVRF